MSKKQLMFLLAIFIILILIVGGIKIFSKDISNNLNNSKQQPLIISDFVLEDRVVMKIDEDIFVGQKEKEIQNGYYDLKISNEDNGVHIYLNKLWYSEYNESFIQEEYLARICRECVKRINITDNKEDIEYELYKYIIQNYLKAKENKQIEELTLGNITASLQGEEGMAKLILEGE